MAVINADVSKVDTICNMALKGVKKLKFQNMLFWVIDLRKSLWNSQYLLKVGGGISVWKCPMFFFQYRECNLEPYTCQANISPLNYILRFFFLIFNLRKGFEKLKFLR